MCGQCPFLGLVKLGLELKRDPEWCLSVVLGPVSSGLFQSVLITFILLLAILVCFILSLVLFRSADQHRHCWPQIRPYEIKIDRLAACFVFVFYLSGGENQTIGALSPAKATVPAGSARSLDLTTCCWASDGFSPNIPRAWTHTHPKINTCHLTTSTNTHTGTHSGWTKQDNHRISQSFWDVNGWCGTSACTRDLLVSLICGFKTPGISFSV